MFRQLLLRGVFLFRGRVGRYVSRTGPAPAFLGRNKKKSERLSKYERHVPEQWKAAILRDAPLLK